MHASLNLAYRLVWSALHNTWVAVAETAKARGKGGSRAMAAVLLAAGLGCAGGALADDWDVTTGNWATDSNWFDVSAPTSADDAIIGLDGGTALLTTAGSANHTYVGYSFGSSTLNISNGGVLSDTSGYIGFSTSSTGTVTVDGANSAWNNSSNLFVGHDGTGTLNINNGGTVSTTFWGYIGTELGSVGSATVSGTGSSWSVGSSFQVGRYGTGTLNINNGGVVNSASGYIGFYADGTGIVNVDGANSNWINSGILTVGRAGTGTLNINNGGVVSSYSGFIGDLNGSTGIVNVDGANSNWTNSVNLTIGDATNSTGTLNISNGGTVSNAIGYIGLNAGSTGIATVDGANSTWTNSNSLFVGNEGTGTLTIRNGGVVSNTHGYIGRVGGSIGTVTVDGAGSAWTNSANFVVGESGTGTITISNGGTVSDVFGYIGLSSGSTGTVIVDGTGSTWTNSADLAVGFDGTGTLTIRNGGTVSNTFGYIGSGTSGTGAGTVTVDGTGATWTNSRDLHVGARSTGTLNISNGGVVSSVAGFIGWDTGRTGTVTVDGANSAWNNSADLAVGYYGAGTLTISNGGTVSAGSSGVAIGYVDGSTGTLNIGAAQGSAAVAPGTLNAGRVAFNSGTGSLVFNHTSTAYDFAPDINGSTGSGSIGLYGGTTRFTGSLSNYTGTMTVDGGTLNIADGSTLFLGGHYTQTANGTLKIGASSASSFGKLDVTGQATFAAGTGINVNVTGNSLANGNTLTNVVQAGNLTASTFTVTDNSTLFNFTASVTAGANGHVDLLTTAASSSGVYDSVVHEGFNPGKNAARILDIFVNGGTTHTDMDNVVTAFGQLNDDKAIANAVAQILPLMNASLTNVTSNTLHGTNRVIQARQEGNRGLSSGDSFLGDKKIWLKPVGSWAHQGNRDNVAGYNANTYGFVAGIDGELNEANRIGVALSYMNSNVDGKSTSSGNRADIDAYQAIAYGSHTLASISDAEINWQADLGLNKNNGQRAITFGGLNRVAKSNYDSTTAHVGLGIARNYAINDKTTITPVIRADYTYIRDESYTETGAAALNLKVKSHSTDELIVLAEGRLSHKLNDKATLVANAGIGYDILDGKNSITASYIGGGSAFSTQGMDVSPWLGRAGLGLTVKATETTEVTGRYDLEGRSDFVDQTASVKVRWAF